MDRSFGFGPFTPQGPGPMPGMPPAMMAQGPAPAPGPASAMNGYAGAPGYGQPMAAPPWMAPASANGMSQPDPFMFPTPPLPMGAMPPASAMGPAGPYAMPGQMPMPMPSQPPMTLPPEGSGGGGGWGPPVPFYPPGMGMPQAPASAMGPRGGMRPMMGAFGQPPNGRGWGWLVAIAAIGGGIWWLDRQRKRRRNHEDGDA